MRRRVRLSHENEKRMFGRVQSALEKGAYAIMNNTALRPGLVLGLIALSSSRLRADVNITSPTSGNIGTGAIILKAPAGFVFDTGGTAPTALSTAFLLFLPDLVQFLRFTAGSLKQFWSNSCSQSPVVSVLRFTAGSLKSSK
jgi:hypothetical protein